MSPEQKEEYLKVAKNHVVKASAIIDKAIEEIKDLISIKIGAAKVEDRWVNESVKAMNKERLSQLEKMRSSPYFSKCKCTFEGNTRDYYFGKFTLPEASIYSWVAPISSVRFDSPGNTSYDLPNGTKRVGKLHEKDDYQITDGKILFYSTESENVVRTLIHQEHFSQRHGFMLPEIVSQMEKAQDKIIRTHHKNSMVISGPAGSGKTTLALHRVAYLLQAPLTTDLYLNSHVTVFVQDQRSKDYFSHLLPELGINTVTIRTYIEWAIEVLGIDNVNIVSSYNEDYVYEQEKIQALRKNIAENTLPNFSKNIFSMLSRLYKSELFLRQKELMVLDRIDLTLLLIIYTRNRKRNPFEYNLIIIDEFQNYIPEQLSLMKNCINPDTKSIIYVGDIAQQINPGSIRDWSEINEILPNERKITLKKVYRNTRSILEYISSLGYDIEIPEGVKDGNEVKQFKQENIKELINNIPKDQTIGILGVNENILLPIRNMIEKSEMIHIMTIRESQGLEFDNVIIFGFDKENYFENYKQVPEYLQKEKQKIDRDLLYIGLTRAIKELYISL